MLHQKKSMAAMFIVLAACVAGLIDNTLALILGSVFIAFVLPISYAAYRGGVCVLMFVLYKFLIIGVIAVSEYLSLPWLEYSRLYWGVDGRSLYTVMGYVGLYFLSFVVVYHVVELWIRTSFRGWELKGVGGISPKLVFGVVIAISVAAKCVLIYLGDWGFVVAAKKIETPFNNILFGLASIDVVVLFFAALSQRYLLLLALGTTLSLGFALAAASKEKILMAVFPLLVYLYKRNKLMAAVTGAMIILLFPLLSEFALFSRFDSTSANPAVQISEFVDYKKNPTGYYSESDSKQRLNYLLPLMLCVKFGPNEKYAGLYFDNSVLGMVPRAIWPEKPYRNAGNEIGRDLGMIVASNKVTNIGVTPIGEGYIQYGVLGLLIGGAWAAIFVAIVDGFFRSTRVDVVVSKFFLSLMIMRQDWLSTAIPSLFMFFVFITILFSLCDWRKAINDER